MKIFHIPPKVRAVLFDIDSTLYTNDAYAFEQVDVQVRRFAKLKGMSAEDARREISQYRKAYEAAHGGQKTSFGNTLTAFGIPISQSIEWRETLIKPELFLKKDECLIDALTHLAKDFLLICVTNNPVLPARKTLECLGVSRFFPHIVGLDTCGVSKPHRAPYEYAARMLDVLPTECVSVGDRYDIDLVVPLTMGMGAILVDGVTDVYTLPNVLGV